MDIIVPEMYLLWGLGHHVPKEREWCAPSGMRIRGQRAEHKLPHKRSRAILAYLATRAVEAGQTFSGQLSDIADMFDVPWPIANIEKHFLCVVHTEFECAENGCCCYPAPCHRVQRLCYDVRYCRLSHKFRITVSDEFLMAARFGIPCPRNQVAELLQAGQLAALDLLIWYRWLIQRRLAASMDVFGDSGPFKRIKSAVAPTKKRDEIVRLHTEVVKVWPDCRFDVSPDGNQLTYLPDDRNRASERNGCLFDISIDESTDTLKSSHRYELDESRTDGRCNDPHVADFIFDDEDIDDEDIDDEGIGDEIRPPPRPPGQRVRKPPMTIPVRRASRPPKRRTPRAPRFTTLSPVRLPKPPDAPPTLRLSIPNQPRPPPIPRLQIRDRASLATGPPERQPVISQSRRQVARVIPRLGRVADPDA